MIEWRHCNTCLNRLPLTFITAIRKFYLDYQLFNIMGWPKRDDNEENRKMFHEFKEGLREMIENNQSHMNLAKIVESACI